MERRSARNLFRYQTGRVIALGRTLFAVLFLTAIWFDFTQPARVGTLAYTLLAFYVLFALAVTALTWRNWWLDARLAWPALLVDVAMFMVIVFSTDGYTSPFYLLFTLPLLTAAIRWTWRETAVVALLLIALYIAAGLLVEESGSFEMQRFFIRSGHLLILSMLLIWFGYHSGSRRSGAEPIELGPADAHRPPRLAVALEAAAAQVGARDGWLLLRETAQDPLVGLRMKGSRFQPVTFAPSAIHLARARGCWLFDLPRDRSLGRSGGGWSEFGSADALFDRQSASAAGLSEGLVTTVIGGRSSGVLILCEVPDLSGDHIAFGRDLGREVGAFLDREALVEAVSAGAGTRERLSLARDVHDSLVQFLAGAAFRVEAMARAARRGQPLGDDLAELKRLIVEEQGDMREFVSALRRDEAVGYDEVVDELTSLAAKLSKQWSLDCRVSARPADGTIPLRVHLDVRQLLREAVANAARHGSAGTVDVGLALEAGRLDLTVVDNGAGFASTMNGDGDHPWSLKERVDRAGGAMEIETGPGRTAIAIGLPLEGAFQ